MEEMRCTQCAAVFYSAAARTLVERGDRCPQCGGEVVFAGQDSPVAVAAEGEGGAPGDDPGGRRFGRE